MQIYRKFENKTYRYQGSSKSRQVIWDNYGVLTCTIYMGKPEIPVGNQMVHTISFGTLQKIWAVISGNEIFPLFLVCSAFNILIYFVAGDSPITSNFIV